MRFKKLLLAILSVLLANCGAATPKELAKAPRVVICSQNLARFGEANSKKNQKREDQEAHLSQLQKLAARVIAGNCDIVALQEVTGATEKASKQIVQQLTSELQLRSGNIFKTVVGPSNDQYLRNGFIYKTSLELMSTHSYYKYELPKLSKRGRPRRFVRGPLEVVFKFPNREIALINFHSKSRRSGYEDPAGLNWEGYRMEMAEAIRNIVETHPLSKRGGTVVVLGDKNAEQHYASSLILSGVLKLDDFLHNKPDTGCVVNKRLGPSCQGSVAPRAPGLLSLISPTDPDLSKLPGTLKLKKKHIWIDDIIIASRDKSLFLAPGAKNPHDFATGIIWEPYGASDHALIYSQLYW